MLRLPLCPPSRGVTLALMAAVLVVVGLLARSDATAVVKDTFEIDANANSGADFSKAGYYAGINEGADDWATGAPIPAAGTDQDADTSNNDGLMDCQAPPASGAQPAFLACNSDRTDVSTCYASRIVPNPNSEGQEVLICDGNSGNNTLQAELDIVSSFSGCSDQKTNDERWCLKTSGVLNNPTKSDETHGYVLINRIASCPDGPDPGTDPDIHNFIVGGYERLSNSGSVFAGFIFAQKSPVTIPSGSNAILSFEDQGDGQGTRRSAGDILVLLNQNGTVIEMSTSVAGADINGDTVPDFGTPTVTTPGTGACGSFAATNDDGDNRTDTDSILAPPWLGNFCAPTAANPDGGSGLVGTSPNQCKVIGNVPPPCTAIPPCPAGGNLVPPSDFVEFALDLTAAGISTNICDLSNVIMTSRSTKEFTADLKDVSVKQFAPVCGAAITIAPSDVNEVGESHTFTVHVTQTINGVETNVAGVFPTITFPDGTPGTVDDTDCTVNGTDADGLCDVIINSAVPGTFTAKATASVNVGGSIKNVSTDPAEGGAGNATKVYVDAFIEISPDAVNEVGECHTFTVHVEADDGSGADDDTDGSDFDPVEGLNPTVTFTDSNGAANEECGGEAGNTCASTGTDANGDCTDSITSSTGGVVTAHASVTFTISTTEGDEEVTRQTDGLETTTGSGIFNSGDATKVFVDAFIEISPDAVNEVGECHTFTVHVEEDNGDGNDDDSDGSNFDPVSGVIPTVTFTDSNGAAGVDCGDANSCTTGTDANGDCTDSVSSATAGVITADASVTFTISTAEGDEEVTRTTGDGGLNSPDATKVFVDAFIEISPDDVNEVGECHTFTVHIEQDNGDGNDDDLDGSNFDPVAGLIPTVTFTDDNGAANEDCGEEGDNTCATGTDANGDCTDSITSSTGGVVTAHASVTFTISTSEGDEEVTRDTDGLETTTGSGTFNSGDATKVFVDAFVEIGPDAVNEVGECHTFTVHVEQDNGDGNDDDLDGSNFDPVAGLIPTVTFTDSNGAAGVDCGDEAANSCLTGTDANGDCTDSASSATAGVITADASVTFTITTSEGDEEVTRTTGDGGLNSPDATKVFVDAFIEIAPDAVNEVGDCHTFTVHIEQDNGDGSDDDLDGSNFDPVAGLIPTVTFTDSNGAANVDCGDETQNSCLTGTDSNGDCTDSITSLTAGKVTAHASVTFTITTSEGDEEVTRETDGNETTTGSGVFNSVDAEKVFVNAFITINPPTATNPAGTNHVLVCHIEVNTGDGVDEDLDGSDFDPAPEGTLCDMDLDPTGPGSFVGDDDDCLTVGATGSCTVTITSDLAGTDIITACTEEDTPPNGLDVEGVFLTRCTDGAEVETGVFNSDPAEKIWVLGSLSWEKRDDLGDLQGGATFEVCRTHDSAGADLVPDECFIVVDDVDGTTDPGDVDQNPAAGQLLVIDLFLGTYTVCETIAPDGFALDDDPCREDIVVSLGTPNVEIDDDFINRLGSITWEKRDDQGNLQGGATFEVTPNPFACHGEGTDPLVVEDNGLNDDDDTAGEISIDRVCLGTYTICETIAPDGFALDDDECREDIVVDADNLDVTVLDPFENRLGMLAWEKRDESKLVNNEHPLQGGATFTVGTPGGVNGDGDGPFACQDTDNDDDGIDEDNPVMVVDDGDGTTDPGDVDQDPDEGQLKLVRVCLGEYTITEIDAPDGYALDDDADRVETVSDDNNGLDDDSDGAIDDAEELNAVIGTQDVDDDVSLVDEFDFHNRRGTLLFEKRAKNRLLGPGETELYTPNATFRITPDPLGAGNTCGAGTIEAPLVLDCLQITDDDPAYDAFFGTDGRICIDGVLLNVEFTIEEVDSGSVAYAIDDDPIRGPVTVTTSTSCADRALDPSDVSPFVNTPLSEVEVRFKSLAGDGVTQLEAPIECDLVPDSGTPGPVDDTDADPGTDDLDLDRNEVFTNLEPGTLTCTIDIDP